MKKIFVILVVLIGFGVSANANCRFEVTDANLSVQPRGASADAVITVTVVPAFTPAATSRTVFTVVVVPASGQWARLLGSQRQSVNFVWNGRSWENSYRTVIFRCSLDDATIRQCGANDFRVDTCFQN